MAQYKFMRKNLSKYKSYLLTSIYGLTLESSKGVKNYISKESNKKNIDGEVIDLKEKLKRGLEFNNKDITNPKFILEENIEFREILSALKGATLKPLFFKVLHNAAAKVLFPTEDAVPKNMMLFFFIIYPFH